MAEDQIQEAPQNPEEREPTEQEKGLAKKLLGQISARKESAEWKKYLENIETNRMYVRGNQHDDGDEGLVRANLIHPELKKAINEAYAKDPDFSVTPTEAVTPERYTIYREFGRTLELVLSSQFSPAQANLKARAKRAVRAADTTGFGWIKIVYQQNIERDPVIEGRIHDVQDDIQRVDKLIADLDREESEGSLEDLETRKEELEQQIKTLESQVEVMRSEGLVMANRDSQYVIFSDDVCAPEDLGRAGWITDEIWMSVDKAKERFGWLPRKATRYAEKRTDSNKSVEIDKDKGDGHLMVCVYEMWRLHDRKVYTLVDGYEGYLKPPYNPKAVGERFHSLFALCFDPVDGSPLPLPLVQQLKELQDEHNTARTNYREHRERNVPFNVAHGDLTKSDVDKLTNPKFMETVVLQGAPAGQPLNTVFLPVQTNPVDPRNYDTSHIREDWERITRRGDSGRGVVSQSKTATEAEILQGNLNVDTSERQDVVEDWLREIAQYSAEICLDQMSQQQVQRIAGPGAQWPQLTKQDIFDLVQLEIKAGSTGKPNHQLELQRWIQMLPELRETLMMVADLNEKEGGQQQANILISLLKESLRRFDERFDVEALIPRKTEQEELMEEQQKNQQLQQQQMQMALEMKALISDIAHTDADSMKKLAEAEAAEIGVQIDQYMAMLQGLLSQQQPPAPQGQQLQ